MAISQSPLLRIAANIFATITLSFGINAMLRPSNGLTFFPFSPPSAADQQLVDALMIIYSARDIFIGVAIYAASAFGNRKVTGCLLIALGATAGVDGEVVRRYGGEGGEWNHWGYAPIVTVVGGLMLGVLDRVS